MGFRYPAKKEEDCNPSEAEECNTETEDLPWFGMLRNPEDYLWKFVSDNSHKFFGRH